MSWKSATKLCAEARNLCRKLAEGEPDACRREEEAAAAGCSLLRVVCEATFEE